MVDRDDHAGDLVALAAGSSTQDGTMSGSFAAPDPPGCPTAGHLGRNRREDVPAMERRADRRQLEFPEARAVESADLERGRPRHYRRQQPVVRREERVTVRDHGDDVALRADARIDDRDMHRAVREVAYARASQNPASAGQYTGTS